MNDYIQYKKAWLNILSSLCLLIFYLYFFFIYITLIALKYYYVDINGYISLFQLSHF